MATLHEAVVKGLAGDRGLYMPESIKQLPQSFFDNIQDMPFQDIAFTVAQALVRVFALPPVWDDRAIRLCILVRPMSSPHYI